VLADLKKRKTDKANEVYLSSDGTDWLRQEIPVPANAVQESIGHVAGALLSRTSDLVAGRGLRPGMGPGP
jgi:hypothetical protein